MINRDEEPSITEVKNQCSNCQHQNPENPTRCQAFPDGIPTVIFMGLYDHSMPYMEDGEVKDHEIHYLPKSA